MAKGRVVGILRGEFASRTREQFLDEEMLDILVLGSAAGGGFPQWNCGCGNCRRARAGDPAARARTQASLAVRGPGGDWFLLNAAPDLRQQIAENSALHPRGGGRDSPIGGVVLSNAEVDHVGGLLHLRERQALVLYATKKVHAALAANPIFGALDPSVVARRDLPLGEAVPLAAADGAGLVVEAFPVPGKVPLYLEDESAGPDYGTSAEDTVALALSVPGGGASFFFIPGCAHLYSDLAERIRGASLVFFDGTLWRDDELIVAGVGAKTGRRMGHMSISGDDGAIAGFAELGVRRKIFIHLNNTNPVLLDDSAERAAVEDAGWEVAYDGMAISF